MNEIECLSLFFVGLGYFLIDKYSESKLSFRQCTNKTLKDNITKNQEKLRKHQSYAEIKRGRKIQSEQCIIHSLNC